MSKIPLLKKGQNNYSNQKYFYSHFTLAER